MKKYEEIQHRPLPSFTHKTHEAVIESGLCWDEADSKRNQLQKAERDANPLKTSWTMDIFILRLEAEKTKAEQNHRRDIGRVNCG